MGSSDMPVAPDDIPTLAVTPGGGAVYGDRETTKVEWEGNFPTIDFLTDSGNEER
jgi:hypothetical protein